MQVELKDGSPVSDSMLVYRLQNRWYIPLTQLLEGLSVPINVSPALGKAEGDFLTPILHFKLDQKNCQAEVHSQIAQFDCTSAVVHDDEIFVSVQALESWFPIRFKIDTFASTIMIESDLKFPLQARRDRDKMAAASTVRQAGNRDLGFEPLPLPEKNWAGPVISQQLSISTAEGEQTYRHDSALASEVGGLETKGILGGTDKKIDSWSLNFAKKDSQAQLLGSLKAREIELLDLSFPSVALLANSFRARGFLVSSFPLSQSSNFSFRDFHGPLPSGWEVELYQNDFLLGRQVASNSTDYLFKEVPLLYGINRFRLVFYGPQGQRREEVETVNIGANLIKPNDSQYRIAVADTLDTSADERMLLQYQRGISPEISMGANYLSAKPQSKGETLRNFSLEVNASLSRMLLSATAAGNDDSGHATQESLLAAFDRGTIGLSDTQLSHFKSDLFPADNELYLKNLARFTANWSLAEFSSLHLLAEINKKDYADSTQYEGTQRTSWQTGPLYWFNTFNYDTQAAPVWGGQLSFLSVVKDYELRPQIDYSKKIDALELSVQKRINDKTTISAMVRDTIKEKITDYRIAFNRILKLCTVSLESELNSRGDAKVQALASYSALLDPTIKELQVSPHALSDYGAVAVTVFLDLDQNGEFSSGDNYLEGVHVLVNQNDTDVVTDDRGHVLITRLPVHDDVDLSLSLKSLPDPLYKPMKKGIRIVPRPGHVFEIQMPVIVQSEIDGLVQMQRTDGLKGKGQMQIEIYESSGAKIKESKSAADGFYLIEGLSTGSYKLTLNQKQLQDLGLVSRPEFYVIDIPTSGLLQSTYDFTLEKVGSGSRKSSK